MSNGYEFTNDWFAVNEPVWRNMVTEMKPRRYLEVGAFEGQSTVYMIENCAPQGAFELACIDTWSGGIEHNPAEMAAVEARFDRNMARAQARGHSFTLRKMKAQSTDAMAQLLTEGGANVFDVAYIDASHQAPDVLADAILAFKLTRVGGIMIFDDYLWRMAGPGGNDILNAPKAGIDAFVNTYLRKLNVVTGAPLRQLYVQKTSD
ncbi:MAG: class I SAM-dependent methyltransferase [Terricaulis sp.]